MHKPARPRPVAPLDRAFDNLKAAEEEAVRQIRTGHIFETDTLTLRAHAAISRHSGLRRPMATDDHFIRAGHGAFIIAYDAPPR